MVSVFGLVSCSQEDLKAATPAPTAEKGGAQTSEPDLGTDAPVPFNTIVMDGIWKTKCIDTTNVNTYKPYIAEIRIKNGKFNQKWTSFNDNECKEVHEVIYSVPFQYSIGNEVSDGIRTFDYFWNYTDPKDGEVYQGKEYNIISVTETVLKFHPIVYEVISDEFDGSSPELRFKSFLNPNLGYVEEYVRQ